MGDKIQRLGIKYQIIKNLSWSFDDEKYVEAARSILDPIINSDSIIPEGLVFPTQLFGTTITWVNNKVATITSGSISLEDDLSDNIVPKIGAESIPSGTFMTNSRYFQTNSKYFLIR